MMNSLIDMTPIHHVALSYIFTFYPDNNDDERNVGMV